MNLSPLVLLMAATSLPAMASQVGIVDSGTYFEHSWFSGKVWTNPNEIVGNLVDDDKNGYVDDVSGWNFAESSSKVFFPEHIANVRPLVFRVFELLGKTETGTMTEEDKKFWTDNVTSLDETSKQKLRDELNFYGQYAHGTHTAGIVAHGNANAIIAAMRIFPDGLPPEGQVRTEGLIYETFAAASNKPFFDVATYLNAQKMDVANYSIGVPMAVLARRALALTGNKNPSDEKVQQEAVKAYAAFAKRGQKWIASAPATLFVIAAGNDGASNDVMPIFPANMVAENSITVAATNGWESLATFSNYSPTLVQVAAPGVAVESSVPAPELNKTLPMSGTSMACPFVTMVASNIKDANPALTPAEMKRILMGTVDKKDWLVGKVATAGVVNPLRAVAAAKLSLNKSVDEAIAESMTSVADMPSVPSPYGRESSALERVVAPTEEMVEWAADLHL